MAKEAIFHALVNGLRQADQRWRITRLGQSCCSRQLNGECKSQKANLHARFDVNSICGGNAGVFFRDPHFYGLQA